MSADTEKVRRRSVQHFAPVITSCPACSASLKSDAKWCPSCQFTGSRTLELFSDSPPPLLPILDAVGIWNDKDSKKITAAHKKIQHRFPQLSWRVCTVRLPDKTALPAFGFWLLNACPLLEKETTEDRAWTVLLLIDIESGQAAAIPGYAAENCLTDSEWASALVAMAVPWAAGETATAVVEFFENCHSLLDASWKRNCYHRRKR